MNLKTNMKISFLARIGRLLDSKTPILRKQHSKARKLPFSVVMFPFPLENSLIMVIT